MFRGERALFGLKGEGAEPLPIPMSPLRVVGAPGRAAPVLLVLVAPREMLMMLQHNGPSEGGWGGLGLPGPLIPLPQHLIDYSDPSDGGGGAGSQAGLSGKVLALLGLFPIGCSPRRESDPAPKRDSHDQGWELPLLCSALPAPLLQHRAWSCRKIFTGLRRSGREQWARKKSGAGGRERYHSCCNSFS